MAGRRKDLGWFPMYATETLADERFQGWTCEERGAWVTLILVCWHEGSIPASPELLRRTLHLDAPAFRVIWEQIGNRFAPSDEDPERLVSPRLEKERAKANRIASERAKAGAEGGKAKAERGRKPSSNCQASAKQNPAVALANPAPTPTPTPEPTEAEAGGEGTPSLLVADSPVTASLPCSGSAKEYGVTLSQVSEWQHAYPGVDVLGEIAKARVWLEANPTRRKTHGGMARFLVAWMGRAQDQPRKPGAPANDRGRQPVGQDFTQQPKW
jgi:uncharacterized protein YdaU (DUF1376 family)